MNEIVTKTNESIAAYFTEEQKELIKRVIAPGATGATEDELKLFYYHCKKTGLDPIAKQIYFLKKNSNGKPTIVFITSIDGLRLIASRTGEHAGTDDAKVEWDGNWPLLSTVTVYRLVKGQRFSFTATARWDEYCPAPPNDFMWKKMPTTMLNKCAEGLALRKAFANELSGLYIKEEMDQDEENPIQPTILPTKENPHVAVAVQPANEDIDINNYKIEFGKYAGKSVFNLTKEELTQQLNQVKIGMQQRNLTLHTVKPELKRFIIAAMRALEI